MSVNNVRSLSYVHQRPAQTTAVSPAHVRSRLYRHGDCVGSPLAITPRSYRDGRWYASGRRSSLLRSRSVTPPRRTVSGSFNDAHETGTARAVAGRGWPRRNERQVGMKRMVSDKPRDRCQHYGGDVKFDGDVMYCNAPTTPSTPRLQGCGNKDGGGGRCCRIVRAKASMVAKMHGGASRCESVAHERSRDVVQCRRRAVRYDCAHSPAPMWQ